MVSPAAGRSEEVNPAPGVWEFQIISSGWLQLFQSEIKNPNLAVVRLESDDIEASRMQALSLGTDVGEIETVPEAVRYFEFRDWSQGVRRRMQAGKGTPVIAIAQLRSFESNRFFSRPLRNSRGRPRGCDRNLGKKMKKELACALVI